MMKWILLTCAVALLSCFALASAELDEGVLHATSYGKDDGFDKSILGCKAGDKFPCGKECKTYYKTEEEKYYVNKPVKYYETVKKPYYADVPYKTYETVKKPYYETTYEKYACGYEEEEKKDYGHADKYSYRQYGTGQDSTEGSSYDAKKDSGGYEKKVKYCTRPKKVLKYKEEKVEKTAYKKELKYKEESVEKIKYEKEEKIKYNKVPYEVCYEWYCKTYTCTKHVGVEKVDEGKDGYKKY